MSDEHIPSNTISEGDNVAPTEGDETGSTQADLGKRIVDAVKNAGKQGVETVDDALKVFEDNIRYAGKTGHENAQLKKELAALKETSDPKVQEKINELNKKVEDATFYVENPEYKEYRGLISQFGDDPNEVVKNELFQNTFKKLQAQKQFEESKKNVLETNPRLGESRDKMTQAKENLEKGNDSAAKQQAVGAVIDAYNLK